MRREPFSFGCFVLFNKVLESEQDMTDFNTVVVATMAGQAFGEDKVMIEAQQKVIDRTPDAGIMPTAHDKGVTLFNRLVERMAKQDAALAA